jgi:hypothetical protein
LSYKPTAKESRVNAAANNNNLISSYTLDYSLSDSLIRLPISTKVDVDTTLDHKNFSVLYGDKTIYQDSYNNYLFNISTTTFVKESTNFTHVKASPSKFKFNH